MREIWVWSLGQVVPLEKGKATHSSILAWRVPWQRSPGYSPWDRKESGMTEWLTLHSSEQVACVSFWDSLSSHSPRLLQLVRVVRSSGSICLVASHPQWLVPTLWSPWLFQLLQDSNHQEAQRHGQSIAFIWGLTMKFTWLPLADTPNKLEISYASLLAYEARNESWVG